MRRVFSEIPIQEVIKVVNQSTSKSEIFNKLECSRNSRNIKILDQIISDYNLDFKKEDSECPFCHKIYKAKGLNYHIRYCKENPDHETHCGNKGATKGKTAWNKGLTAETNESVKNKVHLY